VEEDEEEVKGVDGRTVEDQVREGVSHWHGWGTER